MTKKTLLIMAGGTGGHVFPGIAVAKQLQTQGWSVHWLGTRKRMEAQLVPKQNIPCSFIEIDGLRRKGVFSYLTLPWRLSKAVYQSWRVIKNVQPDLVLGFGGFVAAPGGIAAWLSRIPLLIHEQNAIMGLTNRLLGYLANKVLLGFSCNGHRALKHKTHVVGNPIRSEFIDSPLSHIPANDRPLRLLVVGGSLGANIFNQCIPRACAQLKSSLEIWHQTGQNKGQDVAEQYANAPHVHARVDEFVDDIISAYSWADFVICRAGALTVAELIALNKPSILVPFPYAVDDHQRHNAQFLVDSGGAYLITEQNITAEKLAQIIIDIQDNPEQLTRMRQALSACPKQNAAEKVAQLCEIEYQQGNS